MNAVKQILGILLLAISIQQAVATVDKEGVPQKNIFGSYYGLQDFWWGISFKWSRAKNMLAAFENNDVETFRELFHAGDWGKRPYLMQRAIEENKPEILEIMIEKGSQEGINIEKTYECFGDSLPEKKEVHVDPLSYAENTHCEKSIALVALLRLAKFKSKNGNTDAHIAAEIEPPSRGEKLIEALMERGNFDPYQQNDEGQRVLDIIHKQEIRFCLPPQDGQLLTVEEIEERFQECGIVEKRKKKIISLDEKRYLEECRKREEEKNKEIEKAFKDEEEQTKRGCEETERGLAEALKKNDAAIEEKEKTKKAFEEFAAKKDEPIKKLEEYYTKKNTEQ